MNFDDTCRFLCGSKNDKILLVTEKGYGKKTLVSDFRETSRGSKGVKALNITEKNGNIAAVKVVDENKELVIIIVILVN